ncbi:MAG: hemolysin family protein [Saprospiraceae bacterium]|nr:hemolysin family protein [Saprospiraceae bacterium]
MVLLILFFALSIVFSFLCSIWEAVLLSITPSYVRTQTAKGGAIGLKLTEYKKDIDRPLSAILTLNTIAHTVGAIGVGAQAGELFGNTSLNLLGLELSWESVIAGLMTLAILILSEIIPKTLGANNWRALAPFTIRSIGILLFLLAPLVWLSQAITKRLKSDKEKSVLSRADFAVMARLGEESGALDSSESTIISNLLTFKDTVVRDIMTPKSIVVMEPQSMLLKDFFAKHANLQFSRVPVYGEKEDDITGMVLKDTLLATLADDQHHLTLADIKLPIEKSEANQTLPSLLKKMTAARSHMAVVMNEFGSMTGLVTMEDIIETLLGLEILDETDEVEDLRKLAAERWAEQSKND